MGLRVIVTLVITFWGIFCAVFYEAFYGLITYAFWSYANPEKATWGLLPLGRLSFVVGLIVVLTTLLQRRRLYSSNPKNYLIILFWLLCLLSVMSVWDVGESQWQFKYFTRVILITLIITLLVDDKKRLHYYLWAIVLFIGLIAAQAGVKGTLRGQIGGASYGYMGVIRGGRAFTAVFLCTILPIVFYMMQAEKNKWLKPLLGFTFFGDILAIILTYSRGGFLGLVTIGFTMLIIAKRKILAGIVGFVLVLILFSYFIPGAYINRVETINKPDEGEQYDGSAEGRLMAWRSAIEMIKDKPLTGVGFYRSEAFIGYYPDPKTGISLWGKAIHNSILKVGAELGIPALILFVWIFTMTYFTLVKIKKMVQQYQLDDRLRYYASMFQVAFIGFFSSGFFVNASFVDISWHLVGLTIALEQIVQKELDWQYAVISGSTVKEPY